MANQKISTLPAAAPLIGPELVEVVQGGANVKTTVSAIAAKITTPTYSSAALAGTDDVVLPGAGDYVIGVNTTAGPITYTGFIAQRDGQRLTFNVMGVNILNFNPRTTSAAANQMQASGLTSVVQFDSITWQYSQGVGKWLQV
jgi:UDP-N-acetylmuramyl tripeptide synthase